MLEFNGLLILLRHVRNDCHHRREPHDRKEVVWPRAPGFSSVIANKNVFPSGFSKTHPHGAAVGWIPLYMSEGTAKYLACYDAEYIS